MSTAPTESPTAPTPPAPAAATPPTSAPPAAPAAPAPPAQAETDWKAEARKWEQRAKDNSDAAARLKEIEDASKSAEQKATEEKAAAEKRAAEAEAKLLRYDVATAKKVPADALEFLTGTTREEIEASADKVLKLIAASAAPPPPTGAHVPSEGTSASAPGQLTKADVERMAREGKHDEIEKARSEGRLNDVLGIKPSP